MTELEKLVSKLDGKWPRPCDEIFLKHGELNVEVMNGQIESINGYTKTEFDKCANDVHWGME